MSIDLHKTRKEYRAQNFGHPMSKVLYMGYVLCLRVKNGIPKVEMFFDEKKYAERKRFFAAE